MKAAVFALGAVLATAAACDSVEPLVTTSVDSVATAPPAHSGGPYLRAQEIAALFEKSSVILEPAPVDGLEVFYPNGRHVFHGRVTGEGRYSIANGVLCVQRAPYPAYCRSVFRGEQGELRLGNRPNSTEGSMAVRLVPEPDA